MHYLLVNNWKQCNYRIYEFVPLTVVSMYTVPTGGQFASQGLLS